MQPTEILSKDLKVKVFSFAGCNSLEDKINEWLKAHNVTVYEIKFAFSGNAYSAMILYREIQQAAKLVRPQTSGKY